MGVSAEGLRADGRSALARAAAGVYHGAMSETSLPTPPARSLQDLVALLTLDRLDATTYRGRPEDPGWGRLYGGHVYAQALAAAAATVPGDRPVHTHQGTFLLPGDVAAPITYVVDVARDGRSFSSRRVAAYQREAMIFHATCSFHTPEPGFEHQDGMPDTVPPESVATEAEMMATLSSRLPQRVRDFLVSTNAFELRPTPPLDDPIAPSVRPARRDVWLRGVGEAPDDPAVHAMLLAYASDYLFLTTALMPHGVSWLSRDMHVATLNHALWFHAPFRVDDWLLHAIHSPRASQARGLVQGAFYTPGGVLVATSTQEGLMRHAPRA
jgi:acyl-CoA thioesterase-2